MKNIKKTIVDKAWTNIVRIENLFCNIYDMLPICAGEAVHDFVTSSTLDDGYIIASCYNIDMSKENVQCAFYELLEDAAERYRIEHDYANIEKLTLPDDVHEILLTFPTNNH